MKKPPFQQIEATMLDAQGALVSTTSIDQHLQGYDRFHLRIPIHKNAQNINLYMYHIWISHPTPHPNRTNHKKLSCFIQFVQLPQKNASSKANQNHFLTTQTLTYSPQMIPICFVTNHLTHPPWENFDVTTPPPKAIQVSLRCTGQRCCWVMMAQH